MSSNEGFGTVTKSGRPSKYTEEVAKRICEDISHGKSLVTICKRPEMPKYSIVMEWLIKDSPYFKPSFLERYTRAREIQADYLAEEIIEIADDSSKDVVIKTDKKGNEYEAVDHEVVNRSRLRVDSRKWIASKLKPKKYGDRTIHAGDEENPVNVGIIVYPGEKKPAGSV